MSMLVPTWGYRASVWAPLQQDLAPLSFAVRTEGRLFLRLPSSGGICRSDESSCLRSRSNEDGHVWQRKSVLRCGWKVTGKIKPPNLSPAIEVEVDQIKDKQEQRQEAAGVTSACVTVIRSSHMQSRVLRVLLRPLTCGQKTFSTFFLNAFITWNLFISDISIEICCYGVTILWCFYKYRHYMKWNARSLYLPSQTWFLNGESNQHFFCRILKY